MKKRVTLRDVAAHAGVSRATASLVLRNSPLVAETTRERVQASMQALGYIYNRAAASLRAQQSQTIGLVVTDITNPFFAELAVSIEAQLEQADFTVMLTNTSDQVDKQARVLNVLHGFQVDGLLWCPANDTPAETIAQLQAWRLPLVMITRHIAQAAVDYVGADNVLGAKLAVEHLAQLGHKRIAFVGGPTSSSARHERLVGFREALQENGMAFDPALTASSSVSRQGGFKAMQTVLAQPDPPTAALCYDDVVAFGAMLGLQAAGRTPGHDFAIVGFDDIADAGLVRPALTTIAITPQDIGDAAVSLLRRRMEEPTRVAERLILAPRLVVRESTNPLV